MDFKAAIFDLDGVIVDTAKYHFLAWKDIAGKLDIPFTELDNESLKGVSRMESLEFILGLKSLELSKDMKYQLADEKNILFQDFLSKMDPSEILPGVKSLLSELKEKNIGIALGSASKNAVIALTNVGLINAFEVIVDGTMVKKSKPDPEVFLKAATKLGIAPKHCVVFEDAKSGVQAAKAGGMACVGVGSEEVLSDADLVISSFANWNWGTIIDGIKGA